jgi:prepilin-type processing-associated H-X9-DG protein
MDTKATTPYPVTDFIDSVAYYYIGTGSSGYDWTSCVGLFFAELNNTTDGDMADYRPPSWPLPHGKLANVVCCDGHVVAVPVAVLFNPELSAPHWNVDHQPHPEWWLGAPLSAEP